MKVFLFDDHDKALSCWRRSGVRWTDLVHVDAHSDFSFYDARPAEEIVACASSPDDLKRGLEYTCAYRRLKGGLSDQTTIGNFIYPAMREGIVRDFYWVVPGTRKAFKRRLARLKGFIGYLRAHDPFAGRSGGSRGYSFSEGILTAPLMGRKLVICTLDKLPCLSHPVLLDIDTDFFVNNDLTAVWREDVAAFHRCFLSPRKLVGVLRQRLPRTSIVTIAYSVTGGFTPVVSKALGDQTAFLFDPQRFRRRYSRASAAARHFVSFEKTGCPQSYRKAVRLDPLFGSAYNSSGLLLLSRGRVAAAEKELARVLRADRGHAASLFGMGCIAAQKGYPHAALRLFKRAQPGLRVKLLRERLFFEQAVTAFRAGRYGLARSCLVKLQRLHRGHPVTGYIRGMLYEQGSSFREALASYCQALRCGYVSSDIFMRLFRLFLRLPVSRDTIQLVKGSFVSFVDQVQ